MKIVIKISKLDNYILYKLRNVFTEVKFFLVNKSGKELCKEIIEAFETPFFYLSGTKDQEYLVKKANKAFADRFQQYSDFKEGI